MATEAVLSAAAMQVGQRDRVEWNRLEVAFHRAINDLSGRNIGALAMGGLYLDDLFPHSLGAPLLGPLFE